MPQLQINDQQYKDQQFSSERKYMISLTKLLRLGSRLFFSKTNQTVQSVMCILSFHLLAKYRKYITLLSVVTSVCACVYTLYTFVCLYSYSR